MRLSSFAYIARALRCKNTGCFLAKPYAEAHGNRANSLKFKMKKMRIVTLGYSLVHCWLRNIGDSVNLLANYWLPLIQLLASTHRT